MTFGKRNRFEDGRAVPFAEESLTSRSVKASAVIAMILGASMVLLCGLCTGAVILTPFMPTNQLAQVDMAPYIFISIIALGVGALGIIPGIFLFLIGRSLKQKKPHIGYGIAMSLLALPVGFVGSLMASVNDKVISRTGEFLGWFALLTFLGGILVIIQAIWKSEPVQSLKGSPQIQAAAEWRKNASASLSDLGDKIEDPKLKLAAQVFFFFALVLFTAIAGFFIYILVFEKDAHVLAVILLGALVLGIIGLFLFAMRRHIKHGPNLMSELITAGFGLLTFLLGGLGMLFIAWAIWSTIVRSNHKHKHYRNDYG